MISNPPPPQQGGNGGDTSKASPIQYIFMVKQGINAIPIAHNDENTESGTSTSDHVTQPPPDGLLHFDNPSLNIVSYSP